MLSQRVGGHSPHFAILALDSETKAAEEGPAPGAIAVQGHMVHAGVLAQQLAHEAVAQAFALELRRDEQQPEVGNGPISGRTLFDDGKTIWAPFNGGAASGYGIHYIVLNQAADA